MIEREAGDLLTKPKKITDTWDRGNPYERYVGGGAGWWLTNFFHG
jgi:hypothetical protein